MTEENKAPEAEKAPKKSPVWVRLLKITGFTLLGIVLLIVAVLTLAVWILTPQKLTPIVERVASENLNADVTVDRVELTFWSSFPHLEVEVENLNVVSKSLSSLPDSLRGTLPVWADSLASVGRFNGAINLAELAIGRIALSDITIDRPAFNLLQATADVSNFDIVPPSSEKKEESAGSLPDFSFGEFEITGSMPVRYVSLPDSVDLALTLHSMSLDGKESPVYRLDVDGRSHARVADFDIQNLRLGVGGAVKWNHDNPLCVVFDGFTAGVGAVNLAVDADIDMTAEPLFNSLNLRLEPVVLDSLMAMLPEQVLADVGDLRGDVTIGADVKLTKPYRLSALPVIPSAECHLTVGEGTLSYDRLYLKKLRLDAVATVDGERPDKSVVEVDDLTAIGEGVGFTLDAKVTEPLSDPRITGTFKGGIVSNWLPRRLLSRLPFDVAGQLSADCTFDLRKSFLTRKNFHRVKFTGKADLKNFDLKMHDASAAVTITKADLNLGTNSTINIGDNKADSLLTVSLDIDSVSFFTPGLHVTGKEWKMGLGTLNAASGGDTTVINPVGGKIMARRLTFRSDVDSVTVRLRDATVAGSLTRYLGNSRKPQLKLNIISGRAVYSDNFVRAFLSDAKTSVTLHPSAPRIGRRMKARMDSIQAANPTLPSDSVYARALAMRRHRSQAMTDSASMATSNAFDLDDSTVQLFKKWNVAGDLKAERISVFTPYFPIRNNIRNLDITFSSDSVVVNDTHYRLGKSEFVINGTVSNITRSLTSRRGAPLKINFDIKGDTIDVNRIAAAVFAGAAYSEKKAQGEKAFVGTDATESEMQSMLDDVAANDSVTAIVIPMNIDAELHLRFDNVIYSDLPLHDLKGDLLVYGGAMNLRGLSASTDIGSVALNALYSGADKDDLRFAFGMSLKDFRIARFVKLMPSIDSLMPLLNDISGIINADIAATSDLTPQMDIDIPSLSAAIKLTGDSLVLLDNETFRTVSKWLMFKNKKRNMIDRMNVEMVVENSQVELFPFVFDIDRYKLGVMGHNDLAMNFNYHVAVIKSPLPFKFGINISGNPDKMKIRMGGAKLNEKNAGQRIAIADTTRINLVRQIENSFRRGIRNSSVGRLRFNTSANKNMLDSEASAHFSAADSAMLIKEGLIDAPKPPVTLPEAENNKKSSKKK